jgi:hypothetical protein
MKVPTGPFYSLIIIISFTIRNIALRLEGLDISHVDEAVHKKVLNPLLGG